MQITITKAIYNPRIRSSLFNEDIKTKLEQVYENKPKNNLLLINFLCLLEYDSFFNNREENLDLRQFVAEKIVRQALHSQIIDKCYYQIFQSRNAEPPASMYYAFYTTDFRSHLHNQKVSFKDLTESVRIKYYLDFAYRLIKNQIRTFYGDKCLQKYIQKKVVSTKIKKQKGKSTYGQRKEVKSVTTVQFAKEVILNYLITPEQTDYYKGKSNFIVVLKELIVNPENMNFITQLNTALKVRGNLYKQAEQYLMQIAIYIFFIENLCLQKPLLKLDAKEILAKKDSFNITFNEVTNSEIYEVTITPKPVIFIYITTNYTKADQINDIEVNRFIAFLNQLEDFYFNKLFYTYLCVNQKEKK